MFAEVAMRETDGSDIHRGVEGALLSDIEVFFLLQAALGGTLPTRDSLRIAQLP
jgi:hypothetical protein